MSFVSLGTNAIKAAKYLAPAFEKASKATSAVQKGSLGKSVRSSTDRVSAFHSNQIAPKLSDYGKSLSERSSQAMQVSDNAGMIAEGASAFSEHMKDVAPGVHKHSGKIARGAAQLSTHAGTVAFVLQKLSDGFLRAV